MRTVVTLLLLAGIMVLAYYVLKGFMERSIARRENALNLVEITDVPSTVVDETIPTASTPAFDPLNDQDDNDSRPGQGLRKERDFIDNPVDDTPRGPTGNPYNT